MACTVETVAQKLAELAPLRLAESWDNVGLLIGARQQSVEHVMTCLTITPEVVKEAIMRQVGLIVVHHPLPFKPLARVNSDSVVGRMLLELIECRIAVYSAHTAFDSAADGINALWAKRLSLQQVRPLEPIAAAENELVGAGRYGLLLNAGSLEDLARLACDVSGASCPRIVRALDKEQASIRKVAVACGSGGGFVAAAVRRGCDALVTGEATFHQCLEARASGLGLLLTGHFFSERFAMEWLADRLAYELKDVAVFASEQDRDPVKDVDLSQSKH